MKRLYSVLAALCLAACTTDYQLPALSNADLAAANARLNGAARATANQPFLSPDRAVRNFETIVRRVEPVAEAMCRAEAKPGADCDFLIVLDDDLSQPPNAFHTIARGGRPVVAFNVAMIAEARNQDELAFVMGHEAAHYIADHIAKTQAQRLAGQILIGTLAGSSAPGNQAAVETALQLGGLAYSQTFELEADYLGAIIARRAGYDPNRGALLFARTGGNASGFLSTHPASAARLATVAKAPL